MARRGGARDHRGRIPRIRLAGEPMSAVRYEPLARLHTEVKRRGLMVDVTYAPGQDTHWVIVYIPGRSSEPELIVERDTYQDAIDDATTELRQMIGATA